MATEDCEILIVDDEPRNVRILEEILEDYPLHSVFSGEQCLESLNRLSPKIVFLDVMMPGVSGYEVCEKIKSNPHLKDTTVILVSGKAMKEEREEGLRAGANEYITKPFQLDTILELVDKYLEA